MKQPNKTTQYQPWYLIIIVHAKKQHLGVVKWLKLCSMPLTKSQVESKTFLKNKIQNNCETDD